MNEQLADALTEAQQPFADTRFNVSRLEIVEDGERYRLEGVVLDESTLNAVTEHLHMRLAGTRWEQPEVRILRQTRPQLMAVATNMTGWQREPSWLGEQQSQVINGMLVEILEAGERWSLGRLEDGYLGWVYTGYLTSGAGAAEPTHRVGAPVALLRREPDAGAPLAGRVFAGTQVAAVVGPGEWAKVTLVGGLCGYAAAADLRPLIDDQPAEKRRAQLIANALPYIGVPYLWGGTTAHGIDCSGFAQLMHKLVGVTIPRDADVQFDTGQPIESPYAAGDLLYFGGSGGHRTVSHVGISLGTDYEPDGWMMIHSGRSHNGVYIDDIQAVESLRESFLGGRRFIG